MEASLPGYLSFRNKLYGWACGETKTQSQVLLKAAVVIYASLEEGLEVCPLPPSLPRDL